MAPPELLAAPSGLADLIISPMPAGLPEPCRPHASQPLEPPSRLQGSWGSDPPPLTTPAPWPGTVSEIGTAAGEDGLEVARLGISPRIVERFTARGITGLFTRNIRKKFWLLYQKKQTIERSQQDDPNKWYEKFFDNIGEYVLHVATSIIPDINAQRYIFQVIEEGVGVLMKLNMPKQKILSSRPYLNVPRLALTVLTQFVCILIIGYH